MRSLVLLTILILLCGAGYIGFSILTFEPETPQRYNLTVQITESTDSIGGGNQMIFSTEDRVKKDRMVRVLKEGILDSERAWGNAPEQLGTIHSIFMTTIKTGVLPVFYPVSNYSDPIISLPQEYKILKPVSSTTLQVSVNTGEDTISAIICGSQQAGFIFGDTGDNNLVCETSTETDVRFFLSGPGNDQVIVRGNAVIDGGVGDDKIQAGPELTMIYVSPNFGSDTIEMNCDESQIVVDPQEVLKSVPWDYNFIHFIVFDPRISKKDISVTGNVIEHKITGDKILMNQNCFNIVFASEE